MTTANSVDHEHQLRAAWMKFRPFCDRLVGDPVLVPFQHGEPDWDGTDRDTLTKVSSWADLAVADIDRLAALTDGFGRWLQTSDDISIVSLWREGTPEVVQIEGRTNVAALDLIQDVIAGNIVLGEAEARKKERVRERLEVLRAAYGGEVRERAGDPVLYGADFGGRLGQFWVSPGGSEHFFSAHPESDDDDKPDEEEPVPAAPAQAANDNAPLGAIDAETLLGLDFPPVEYVVPGYVTEGLTILAGRPKLGKSWMALGMCVGVASGGQTLDVDCEPGDALYLALEDNRRRLQDRLKVVLPRHQRPDVRRLQLLTEAPKVNAGLLQRLDQWRTGVSQPKLVVIDTLSMVRPPKKANQDSYAADYDAISPLQKWAGEHRLAVVVVHHVRKAEADDPLESVSGTNGLTGAADTILVLNRTTDGPKLYGRGRDIEEFEKALRLQDGLWSVLGDADDVRRSEQRKKILGVLQEATGAMTPAEIAKETGTLVGSVNYLLRAMVKAGEAEKIGYGAYKMPGR